MNSTFGGQKFPSKWYVDWLWRESLSGLLAPLPSFFSFNRGPPLFLSSPGGERHGSRLASSTGTTQANPQLVQFLHLFHGYLRFMRVFLVFCSPFSRPFHHRSIVNSTLSMIYAASIRSVAKSMIFHNKCLRVFNIRLFQVLTQTELAVLSSTIFSNSHVSLSVTYF